MSQPTAAMVVIGDEILSGRTRDSNANHLACVMTEMGIRLSEVRMIADDPDIIVAAVNAVRETNDYVFTSGGIGPTHDDITADCIAAAFGVAIDVRDDARAILARHYEGTDRELNAARLRMARIPDGADLIDNPVSGAPGFRLGNVHVMAGVPKIFEAMVESVRPTLLGGDRILSHSLRCEIGEGDLAGPLGAVAEAFPDVSMGSYPFGAGAGSVLVLRSSDRVRLAEAAAAVREAVRPLGGVKTETPPE
ncbi:MAG: competence/damage-inducible protein A [Paracoccaceae bacterium]